MTPREYPKPGMGGRVVAVYVVALAVFLWLCATHPRVVAIVWGVSGAVILLSLLTHHGRKWLGLK